MNVNPAVPPANEKAAFVRDIFAKIAPRYDLTNRIISAGMDEGWRKRTIALLQAPHGGRIVDLCCGTGDFAFHLLRTDPSLHVTAVDFCEPMLAEARKRANGEGSANASFVEGDVMKLTFADKSFDGATMGFATRNVAEIDGMLREVLRVLKPGARFVNLDMSIAPNRVWKACFDLYFYRVVPLVGRIFAGSGLAYSYLPHSLTKHPGAEALRERFAAAGFSGAGFVRLMGGSVAIHYGTAP